MKELIELLVDFQNCDTKGRVRINTRGALEYIEKHQLTLKNDMKVYLYDDDEFYISGVLTFSEEENIWWLYSIVKNFRYY